MAERPRRPSSELGPDFSPPRNSKRSRLLLELAEEEEVDTVKEEESLESNETLHSPKDTEEESYKSIEEEAIAGPSGIREISDINSDEDNSNQETSDMKAVALNSTVNMQSSLIGDHALYIQLIYIGNGAYGTVYKARDSNTGQVVALKKVRIPLSIDGLPTSTVREISTLKQLERLDYPHIVRLLDVCQGKRQKSVLPFNEVIEDALEESLTLWLVFEHVEQDLASYISSCSETGIPPNVVKRMFKDILLGIDFLHGHRIIHRDLKPQNLLVTSDRRIKIADFGLAKTYSFDMVLTSVVVTQWYRAPEVLLGCSYASSVDMWSAACILAEISKLKPLFPGTSEGDQLDRIFQIIGTPRIEEWPENVSLGWNAFPYRRPKPLGEVVPNLAESGLDLLQKLLTFNPHYRLTAYQALRHRYFTANQTS
ncbi:PREDICTED: cyclin-dependent kinase 4-like isoform X2 [Polistes dominula]|nr:PREDICTED: cyclin-dependent kinase 4-like isoform X2 [Polistes dominula]XP_015182044.1 PREDICTED: cyclin-dependent kinase 4-like isoform X2 [Polistes dominula]XP_015182045.1 PREDICTED: cyclin-dependent kinase 4-like isoform X2 [Polistes dominula]XP_015182046.1 PREDICTED: cyclin-dependent kinase 4-like isoform X2 [Polistes dominula]